MIKCHCCSADYVPHGILESVYRCSSCAHNFIDYKGDDTLFHSGEHRRGAAPMRRVSDEFDSQGRVTEKFHKARKRICVSRVGYIEEYITTVQTCLDVGAGAGTFAHRLERSHPELDIECLELDPMIVEECQRLGFHTYNKSFFENKFDKTYDVVFLWHVLEHVKDAHAFLSKAVTLADKYVILEVPLLQAMNGTGRIRSLKAPNIGNYDGHAHYFNKQSFIKLVEKIDHLEIIEIREGTQTPALFSALSVK